MSKMKDYLIYLQEKYPDKENEELIEMQKKEIQSYLEAEKGDDLK
jgi:rRNA pseudouridine-1189 N-methylase Emg1 (Nep1/Mra1 family)